jgi:hypothetical protein
VTLVALSLSHLARGIEIITAAPAWEAYALAVGVDLGFVAVEGAQLLAATEKLRKALSRYTRPAIIGTLVGSAGMNAYAFAAQASGAWHPYAAAVLGIAVTSLIYPLTRIGAALWADCHARA